MNYKPEHNVQMLFSGLMNYKPEHNVQIDIQQFNELQARDHNVQIVIQQFNERQARAQCTDSYLVV